MLKNKIKSSLYLSILFKIALSSIVSLILFLGLSISFFSYSESKDRSNGSSGLGLSIVTELLRHMGGSLALSCDENTFTAKVNIPLKKETGGCF